MHLVGHMHSLRSSAHVFLFCLFVCLFVYKCGDKKTYTSIAFSESHVARTSHRPSAERQLAYTYLSWQGGA
jgi:hypothetical protein